MKLRALALTFSQITASVVPAVSAAAAPPRPAGEGYAVVSRAGGAFTFGGVRYEGSLVGSGIHTSDVVGVQVLTNGRGYWMVTPTGQVYAYGQAKSYGSANAVVPIVGIAGTPDGLGYWLIDQNGDIWTMGDAHYYGSPVLMGLNVHNIVAMAATLIDGITSPPQRGPFTRSAAFFSRPIRPDFSGPAVSSPDSVLRPGGFWLVSATGGIFAFHAHYYGGSPSGKSYPIVGMASTPDSGGCGL